MISAVILAAGRAERMGEAKLFLPLGEKPVLQWVIESALASDLDEVICVSRELESARRQIKLADERLFWLLNYAADRGQSTSVIAGLWAVNPECEGVMLRRKIRVKSANILEKNGLQFTNFLSIREP